MMTLGLMILVLSVPGAFMVASRRMEVRKLGFVCIILASGLQALVMLETGQPWLCLSSLVFTISGVIGLMNNWKWRKDSDDRTY